MSDPPALSPAAPNVQVDPGVPGRVLGALLAGAVVGTALQLQQSALWDVAVYASIVLVALVLLGLFATLLRASGYVAPRARGHWRSASIGVGLAAAMLAFGATGWRAGAFAADRLDPALEGRDLQIEARVVAMPQRNAGGLRLRLAIDTARTAEGQSVRLPAQADVAWYRGGFLADEPAPAGSAALPADLRAGDRWRLTVRLRAPHGQRIPLGFDYELWMWEQGVQATGYVRSGPRDPAPERLETGWSAPVERLRQSVRDAIFARLAPLATGAGDQAEAEGTGGVVQAVAAAAQLRTAGIVAALVTGDQRAIEQADWDVFRATGVAHLMSISGLHITLFAWAAALAIGFGWRKSARCCLSVPAPVAALVGGVLLAAAYALFSGWGVPAQRTVWMLATIALIRLSGRQWPWPMVWLLACAVVVAIDPWALMQAGFWLSFVAVAVLFATDSGAARPSKERARARFCSKAALLVREQGVVTLALTPLTLLWFGQVSLVGFFANLLAIPWVTLVVTPLALLGVALPIAWDLAALAVRGLALCLQWLAAVPGATVSVAIAPWWVGAAGVLGGVLLALRLPWSWRLLGLPLLLPVLLWQPHRPAEGAFELTAVDIGQGNAVWVRTANHSLLYDTGPRLSRDNDAGNRVLVPLLRAFDAQLDMVMLSHRDSDHTGGAQSVLAAQPGAALTGSLEAGHPLWVVRPGSRCVAGQHWTWDGVAFEVLHPQAADYDRAGAKPNTLSCVLRISAKTPARASESGVTADAAMQPVAPVALLAGDIERAQEAQLVQSGVDLHASVLLVPHHGSKTSSSAVFLDAVAPRWALVQSGYRNRFGHPTAEVVDRLTARGIGVVDSPHCGAAEWSSARPDQIQCARESGRRYWHHILNPQHAGTVATRR